MSLKYRHTFSLAMCAIAASTSLVACSSASEPATEGASSSGMENTSGSAPSGQNEQDRQFDTGPYRTTPHSGWTMDDRLGAVSETNAIAQNTLLPYEVDANLKKGRAPQRQTAYAFFTMLFDKPTQEALAELEPNFLTGFANGGKTENGDKTVDNGIYRFVDAASAQRAVDIISQRQYPTGTTFPLRGDEEQLSPLEIPGHPEAVGKASPRLNSANAAIAHNEFVIFTSASNKLPLPTQSGEHAQTSSEGHQWMAQYFGAFFGKQIPLLDTIPTKKTEQGFGKSDEWPPLDPDGMLKYTVMPPDEVDRVGPHPAATNSRMMAGNYVDQKQLLSALDQANVVASAQGETMLFRTKNQPSAELLRASMNVIDATGAPQEYDEPQGLPGTTCYTAPTERGNVHTCHLVEGNYFATASVREPSPALDETPEVGGKETAAGQTEDVDPRKRLSQIMAAQYVLLKDAPKSS